MAPTNDPATHIPLSNLSFHIMLALGEEPAHGYAIGKEVQRRSRGKLNPTTGGLYQALKRLTEDGLVGPDASAGLASTDSRRQYFQLTAFGRQVVALEAARLDSLVADARSKNLFPGSL